MQQIRRSARYNVWVITWLLVLVGMARAQPQDAQSIRGFEVPEFDRENRLQSMLYGELARLLPSGMVDITDMRIEFYDDDRVVEMLVTAETCLYDRNTRSAESDAEVRIARDNIIITGRGFNWQPDEEQFQIHNEAKVVLKEARSIEEELGEE